MMFPCVPFCQLRRENIILQFFKVDIGDISLDQRIKYFEHKKKKKVNSLV